MVDEAVIAHSRLLFDAYKKETGKKLIEESFSSDEELAEMMYHAPFAILSHDAQDDPVFNYANETAQRLWEMSWQDFTKLPSRFSAEPVKEKERNAMLEGVREKGFITGYSGIRISRSGKRFTIKNATLWNIHDEVNVYYGQAVVFYNWEGRP